MDGVRVSDAAELRRAVEAEVPAIRVVGTIGGLPSFRLPPGTELHGGALKFGGRGIVLTRDNTLRDIVVETAPAEIAVGIDTDMPSVGTLRLANVATVGQIALVFEDAAAEGSILADHVTVRAADLRGRAHRPRGFGVEVLQGAFTVWNRQRTGPSAVRATLRNISAGGEVTPVRGSGVFAAGSGVADGGILVVDELTTGPIVTDGGIAPGAPDVISGGVFLSTGTVAGHVANHGPVSTYGQNDMVLDNWGSVTLWEAHAPLTSYGDSGIGFVNFGDIDTLQVTGPVTTYGTGARGFNLYDGSLKTAEFGGIGTRGDGAVGVQLSRPMGSLTIRGDLVTAGGVGTSLVKGVQTQLPAVALSIKPGGGIDHLRVDGDIAASGEGVSAVELAGPVGSVDLRGRIRATGAGSEAVAPADDPRFTGRVE
jgi:hypothetical protein